MSRVFRTIVMSLIYFKQSDGSHSYYVSKLLKLEAFRDAYSFGHFLIYFHLTFL